MKTEKRSTTAPSTPQAHPSIDEQAAELLATGWERLRGGRVWKAPNGGCFQGPHGAWLAMKSVGSPDPVLSAEALSDLVDQFQLKLEAKDGEIQDVYAKLLHERQEREREARRANQATVDLKLAVADVNGLTKALSGSNADNVKLLSEIADLETTLSGLKTEIQGGANFGKIVELLFYGPLRDAERKLRVVDDVLERSRWRPISEMHEDLGQCILINLADHGNMVIGNNLCDWYNADDWTHFAQVPSLTHEEAARLAAEMAAGEMK